MKRIPYLVVMVLLGVASTAQAGVKEELVRLQTDVLALKNQILLIEKTFNERTDGIRSLVVQLNDQVGKTSLVLGRILNALETQSSGDTTTLQAVLKEVKELSNKMDETNTRMSALAQQIADMKVQSKPVAQRAFQAAADNPDALAISADQIYSEAYNDLVQGNLDLAIQGFNAFLKSFPTNDKADDAQYNIGEAFYNDNKYPQAIAAFTKVVTDYAGGGKVASALFKRGKSELALRQKDAAVADFRTLVDKFSTAPEASLARAELQKLGIDPSKPGKTVIKKRGEGIAH
ncbi:MAG: outer membrane protein assembly factor BamD [Acidobacteriia bacterium]|nr:outer membrane protein assembly factor BamD [Terriglobia bacterium]